MSNIKLMKFIGNVQNAIILIGIGEFIVINVKLKKKL